MKIAVIGAGALGGWVALFLRQSGHSVTLIDGHGTANARSSSGDETRVIRTVYKDEIYTRFTLRSMELWKEHESLTGDRIFYRPGVLNVIGRDESRWLAAKPNLDLHKIQYTQLSREDMQKKYPCISRTGVQYAVLESGGGYLLARKGCESVLKRFMACGGQYLREFVHPVRPEKSRLGHITTLSGSSIEADLFVVAAGPWLSSLMPELLGSLIQPSRQDLFYFGVPAASMHCVVNMPAWCDFSSLDEDVMYYGIPANDLGAEGFGFKVGEDVAGPGFDPETGERLADLENLRRARRFMEQRFPFMKDAPLVQSRVCQYENSPDAHLIADRAEGLENVWILGGGSGHGYKLGASMGEYLCKRINGEVGKEAQLSFSRFHEASVDTDKRR